MQMIKPLKVVALFFSMFLGSLASDMNDSSSESLYSYKMSKYLALKELLNPLDSLNWLTRLFQYKDQLSCELGPDYAQLLKGLDKCNADSKTIKCITKATNELFSHVMKSDSKPDKLKVKILQSVDPRLNDVTAAHLINPFLDDVEELTDRIKIASINEQIKSINSSRFKDIPSTMDFLYSEKRKLFGEDCKDLKIRLSKEYGLTGMSLINSSIWFLVNQCVFYGSSLNPYVTMYDRIGRIFHYGIILRADVDIEHLSYCIMDGRKDEEMNWDSYVVEKLPFSNTQSYDICIDNWGLISKLLLLEDPRSAIEILGKNFPYKNYDIRNYLLLLHDNPARRLMRIKPYTLKEMYWCFIIASNIELGLGEIAYIRGIPNSKFIEVAGHLVEYYNSHILNKVGYTNVTLYYLSVVSLLGSKGTVFNMDFARAFALMSKTLELLDVLKGERIEDFIFDGKSFRNYFYEEPNWDDAVVKHFHYFISRLTTRTRMWGDEKQMAESLAGYIGVDTRGALPMLRHKDLTFIDNTLDKVPRHLNDCLAIINEQPQKKPKSPSERFEIAIRCSLYNNKDAKKDFVYYQLNHDYSLNIYLEDPVFVYLARMRYKHTSYKPKKFLPFLYFEYYVYKYFSDLARMDVERGFKKLQANSRLSVALEMLIKRHFREGIHYAVSVPSLCALGGLQNLERELCKHRPEIFMELELNRMPRMTLLRAIYMALADPFLDLGAALIMHLLMLNA